MQEIKLDYGEAELFARAALTLKYDDPLKKAPVTENQILLPRHAEDCQVALLMVVVKKHGLFWVLIKI